MTTTKAPKPAKPVETPPLPTPTEGDIGVCARVRAFANANVEMTRKDVVAAMVAQGINKATAAIQTGKADKLAGRERPA